MNDPRTLNLKHLAGLVAVIDQGGVGRAADALFLSQPALTHGLAKLERLLTVRLLARDKMGTVATPAGADFARRVTRALAFIDRGQPGGRASPSTGATLSRQVTMRQLHALLAVAQAGSFAAAAVATALSAASLHRLVRELEAVVGAPLLTRTPGGCRATGLGRELVERIGLAFAELRSGMAELARDRAGRRIVVGGMPLVRAGLLPLAMARMNRDHPDILCHVVEGPYEALIARLIAGDVDLVVGALRGTETPRIVEERLFDDDLIVTCRIDHPLARQKPVTAEALARHPWIASPPGTPRRDGWERMFRDAGHAAPQPKVECSSGATARALLLQGDWLALLSPQQFAIERNAGLLTGLAGMAPVARREVGITTRRDWLPTAWQEHFVEALRAAAGDG